MVESKHVAIVISIFSLAVSGMSMYYSNIRKTEYIAIAAEWMKYPVKKENKLVLPKLSGKFLIINGGNTPASVMLYGFLYSFSKDKNDSCGGKNNIFVSTDASATVVKAQEMMQIDGVINSVRDADNVVDDVQYVSFTPRFAVNIGDYITKCAVFNYSTMSTHNKQDVMVVESGQIDISGTPSYTFIQPSAPFVIRDTATNSWPL